MKEEAVAGSKYLGVATDLKLEVQKMGGKRRR